MTADWNDTFELIAGSGLDTRTSAYRRNALNAAEERIRNDSDARSHFIAQYQRGECRETSSQSVPCPHISAVIPRLDSTDGSDVRSIHVAKRLALLYKCCCISEVVDDDNLLVECCKGLALHCGRVPQRKFLQQQAEKIALVVARERIEQLCTIFHNLAASSSPADARVVIPAIALGWALQHSVKSEEKGSNSHDWWSALVNFTVANFSTDQVDLVQDVIRANFPEHHADFLRTLLLKLRSHPEKALCLVAAYVPYCDGIQDLVDDDFRKCLVDHLIAPSRSETARSAAATCLGALVPASLHTICAQRLPTQVDGKRAIYEFLLRSGTNDTDSEDEDGSTATLVLQYLCNHAVTKNDSAAMQDVWYAAVVEWMVRSGGSITADNIRGCSIPRMWQVAVERGHAARLAGKIPPPSPPTSKNKPVDALYAAYWRVLNGKSAGPKESWLSQVLDLLPDNPVIARALPAVLPDDPVALAHCVVWGNLRSDQLKDILPTPDLISKVIPVVLQQWQAYGERRHEQRTKSIMERPDDTMSGTPLHVPNFAVMRVLASLATVPETMLLLHCHPHMAAQAPVAVNIWQANPKVDWAQLIQDWCASPSPVVQESAWRTVRTWGLLSSRQYDDEIDAAECSTYQAMHETCIQHVCPALQQRLVAALSSVEELTEHDVKLILVGQGRVVSDTNTSNTGGAKANKRLTQEEEWDLEIKREIQAKKGIDTDTSVAVDPKVLAEQDARRLVLKGVLDEYTSVLSAIRNLVLSDIEVGNECLPKLSGTVTGAAVSLCPVVKSLRSYHNSALRCLTALTTCVYEIEEKHSQAMTVAIQASSRGAFSGRFDAAAVVIQEMDDFSEALSGGSWALLFPVVRSCLLGPRTPTGCDSCLRVLNRHADVLVGELQDAVVVGMRKDMSTSVLELLKHDRSQAFHDPDPYETLVNCYASDEGPPFSTAEMSPLLDERGALGSRNCRIGSLMALEAISKSHQKFLKMNPLVENRVWLNCFAEDEDIRSAGWEAWGGIQGFDDDMSECNLPKPSPLYATPLLALLSHQDGSISAAASKAYAHAMGLHAKSIERNVEGLCTIYIDSFPSKANAASSSSTLPLPAITAPKKKISTGLPKRKGTVKKSALDVAGIGRPKAGSKKKSTHSALLKPKQERTLDQEALANQFKPTTQNVEKEEKDSSAKVAARLGVLKAMGALPKTAIKVDMSETTLKLLTSFLMAYGIADSDDKVQGMARNVLRDVLASFGDSPETVAFLLPHLESVLKTGVAEESTLGSLATTKVPNNVDASDRRKEGAVVALGSVVVHLSGPENDEKVDSTVDMLISALKTPNEEVQLSVADTLVKLMKKGGTQNRVENLIADLLDNCLAGSSLALRRGSAYGLAAAVKGSGIGTLKKYEIVKKLDDSCSSGNASGKEGSLFAIELLSSRLGLLFEPHVIVLLPSLLKAFSDSSDHVRKAANDASGLIMSKLSAHGVKLVLPAVLTAFGDSAWRTKQASIHMLGAMSHLAPKQLASALPKVVPQLTGTLFRLD